MLLKSRVGMFVLGLPLLAISIGCLAVIHRFLSQQQKFDAFDWFVFVFFNEFFGAGMLLGVLLTTCAVLNPSWLHKLILDAASHLRWMAIVFFGSLVVTGVVGGLIVVPCLVALGVLE